MRYGILLAMIGFYNQRCGIVKGEDAVQFSPLGIRDSLSLKLKMALPANREEVKKLAAPVVFVLLTVLSLPFAYLAFGCHSYPRAPIRFAIDMLLRALLIALPFCLGLCAFGFIKKRPWVRRCAIYVAVMSGLILGCLMVELYGQ